MTSRSRAITAGLCLVAILGLAYGAWRYVHATDIEMAHIERIMLTKGFRGMNGGTTFHDDGTFEQHIAESDVPLRMRSVEGTWQLQESGSIIMLTMTSEGRTRTRRMWMEGYCLGGMDESFGSCE